MPDFSLKAGGNFSFATALMSQSLVIFNCRFIPKFLCLPILGLLFLALNQSVVDHFKYHAPFMGATVCIAVAAGWAVRALPGQYIIQRPSLERLFGRDAPHKRSSVVQVFALTSVAGISDRRDATRFDDSITLLRRSQSDVVIKFELTPHV